MLDLIQNLHKFINNSMPNFRNKKGQRKVTYRHFCISVNGKTYTYQVSNYEHRASYDRAFSLYSFVNNQKHIIGIINKPIDNITLVGQKTHAGQGIVEHADIFKQWLNNELQNFTIFRPNPCKKCGQLMITLESNILKIGKKCNNSH